MFFSPRFFLSIFSVGLICVFSSVCGAFAEHHISQEQGRLLSYSFYPDDTGISSEMRQIGATPEGDVLFASDRALITFNGTNWEVIEEGVNFTYFFVNKKNSLVYTTQGEIWETWKDELGKQHKIELTKGVSEADWHYQGIKKIFEIEGGLIVFNSNQIMLLQESGDYRVIDLNDWMADLVEVNGRFFVLGGRNRSVVQMIDLDSAMVVDPPDEYINKDLLWPSSSIESSLGYVWIATQNRRILRFDLEGLQTWSLPDASNTVLPSKINCLTEDQNHRLLVGTQNDGIFVFHRDGQLIEVINEESGLESNSVTHLHVDSMNGLWVSMRGVVQHLELDRVSVSFDASHGLDGEILCINRFLDELYVGTEIGMFVLEEQEGSVRFKQIPGFNQVKWMSTFEDQLLFIDSKGLGVIHGDSVEWLIEDGILFAIVSSENPGFVFYENVQQLKGLKWTGNHWEHISLPGVEHVGGPLGFAEDKDGWIWSIIYPGKCMRFRYDESGFSIEEFGSESGVPSTWAQPFVIDGECFLGNQEVKKWSESQHQFVAAKDYRYYEGWIPFGFEHVMSKSHGEDGVWVSPGYNVGNLVRRPKRDAIASVVINGSGIDTRANVVFWDRDQVAWIGSMGKVIRFDNKAAPEQVLRQQISIRNLISIEDNELIFSGDRFPELLRLDYSQRSIRVEACLRDYSSVGFVRFAIHLEGFKRGHADWSESNYWEFTNLDPGRYTLNILGHDATGFQGITATVPFVVLPPWYASIPAYIGYILGSIFAVLILLRIRTARLLHLNRSLELAVKTRTEEVTAQSSLVQQQNKELNAAKERSDKLVIEAQAAANSKSQFLANMSHEIRTPMNGVIGMCNLLRNTSMTSQQSEYVNAIKLSGDCLLSIINDILDFSKSESGALELEHVAFNLDALTSDILDLLGPEAHEKNLELLCDIDPSLAVWRMGDPVRLQQVIMNLVGNAIKFTAEGEVIFRAINKKTAPGVVRFEIIDTGIGIFKENRNDLFNPFSQVDSSITRRFGGTGLGLAICRKMVDLMGGSIECESKFGEGTMFAFEVELSESSLNESSLETSETPAVVWLDLNETRRNIIQRNLGYFGCEVALYSDIDALENITVQWGKKTFVFVDHKMIDDADPAELDQLEKLSKVTKIVVLSIPGRSINCSWERFENVERLSKPVTCSRLYHCLFGNEEGTELEEPYSIVHLEGIEKLNVMVVEDNEINQRLAVLTMESLGIHPDVFDDGLKALEAVKQKDYHLILMDIQMPNMGGFEATREIRSLQGDRFHSCVYALTAGVAEFDSRKCQSNGMDGFIAKPFKIEDLQKVVVETMKYFEVE